MYGRDILCRERKISVGVRWRLRYAEACRRKSKFITFGVVNFQTETSQYYTVHGTYIRCTHDDNNDDYYNNNIIYTIRGRKID